MTQKHRVFDADAMFWDDQSMAAFTIGAHNSASIDLGAADMNPVNPPMVQMHLLGLVGVGATVQITLEDSADNVTFAPVTPAPNISDAHAITVDLTDVRFTIPPVGIRRYVRLVITVAGANITAGTVNAGLV